MLNIYHNLIVYYIQFQNPCSTQEVFTMEITDIKVRKLFDDDPMKAIVSVTFDNQLAVHDIKVINARDRLFIVMPSRKNPDGTYRDIVHPINGKFRTELESAVIEAYEAALAAAAETAEASDDENIQ